LSAMAKAIPSIQSTAQLAKHLKLSRWTVSRALNGHPAVKAETRRRVEEAAQALHFVPSALARGLQGGRTGTIGVCFNELESPVLVKKISILHRLLRERGLRGLIELTHGEPQAEREVIAHFVNMRVDGIVTVYSQLPSSGAFDALLAGTEIGVVHVDPLTELLRPAVTMNRALAMKLLVQHIVDRGRRRLVLLGIRRTLYPDRWRGLRAAFRKHRLAEPMDVRVWAHEDSKAQDYSYGRQLAEELLADGFKPTAILALNDRVAIGAMTRLQEAGWRIPEDCFMAGFDNLDITEHCRPTLTTIDHHSEELMARALAILLGKHPSTNGMKTLAPSLMIRASTAAAGLSS
jgi:DNA-binding LacI/PurR family transcriptional regulator